jgi:DMSO/TMAO reductase YedYZ molybdopterin-dependent catalytic subunit
MGIKDPAKHVQHLKDRASLGSRDGITARIPPGQHLVDRFPVLHYGEVPRADLEKWDFRVWGLVEKEVRWTYPEFTSLPTRRIVVDIHCVTRWTMLDMIWEGVPFPEVMKHVQLRPEAKFVMVHAESGFTTNLPLEDVLRDDVLFCRQYNDAPLAAEHGYPMRLVVPHLYFWKSAKWVRGLEFIARNRPGFWESYGYHMRGDPWTEERFGG